MLLGYTKMLVRRELLRSALPDHPEIREAARSYFPRSLRERFVHWQGLEMRLTRMFGAAPVKDLQKLERYEEKASEIWQWEVPCECGQCPVAIARETWLEEDFALRLHTFAPEIKARMK